MAGLVGVFGGTFDPLHYGHLILAEFGGVALGAQKVLWVLTPNPPHKTRQLISPVEVRTKMVQTAIKDNPRFELSRVDLDRHAPHYTLGTMEALHNLYPDSHFAYLMGSDSLHELPTWYQPNRFVELCDSIGVMHRPGVQVDLIALENTIRGIRDRLTFFQAPHVDISATDIRRRVKEGETYRYLVPESIAEIIVEQGLYR
jgi:nicotinate-nucleotide adenylyltransferase